MATPQWDPHAVLGVSRNASKAEIKSAFRKLSLECHPDLNKAQYVTRTRSDRDDTPALAPSPTRPLAPSCPLSSCRSAESKFVAINKAYTSLTKSHGRSGRAATAGAFYRQAKPKASNGILAGVLVGPLVMLGFYMSKSRELELAEASDAMKSRPLGFWYPPHNEFLREDLRPREKARRW